jgi:putative Flp pilus-assembly TadE/G-like protein
MPLLLGLAALTVLAAVAVATLGRAQLAKARAQSAADTAALSAGRRLRQLLPALVVGTPGAGVDPAPDLAVAAAPAAAAAGARVTSVAAAPTPSWPPIAVDVRVEVPAPMGLAVGAEARAGLALEDPAGVEAADAGCPAASAALDLLRAAAAADGVLVPARTAPDGALVPSDPAARPWLEAHGAALGFGRVAGAGGWFWAPGCPGARRAPAPPAALPDWVPAGRRPAVWDAALGAGVPPLLLAALLRAEGALGEDASGTGAAAARLGEGLRAFGSAALAVAAYDAGPYAVRAAGGVPSLPGTRSLVARVLALAGGAGALGEGSSDGVVLLPLDEPPAGAGPP